MKLGSSHNLKARCFRFTTAAQSSSKAITMHRQVCHMLDGNIRFVDLKLFLKNGEQYARSAGQKKRQTFKKNGAYWEQTS